MEGYFVPADYGEAEYIEKRSRFIGHVWRIENEEEALTHLKKMREKYWDASHNVYAYSVKNGGIMRYSDDGEPSGTSGMPVLNVFRSGGVQDFCCVVTRYFGGTLLGAGGLVRAYSKTASMALDNAGKAVLRLMKTVMITCSYPQFEKIKAEAVRCGAAIDDVMYGAEVQLFCSAGENELDKLQRRVREITAATAQLEIVGETMRAVRL